MKKGQNLNDFLTDIKPIPRRFKLPDCFGNRYCEAKKCRFKKYCHNNVVISEKG